MILNIGKELDMGWYENFGLDKNTTAYLSNTTLHE